MRFAKSGAILSCLTPSAALNGALTRHFAPLRAQVGACAQRNALLQNGGGGGEGTLSGTVVGLWGLEVGRWLVAAPSGGKKGVAGGI